MTLTKFNGQSPRLGKLGGDAYCILYVEDEDQNWEIAEAGLRDKYRVIRAKDAKETFAALRTHNPDLVLMDIQLSGSDLDGIEITKALRGTLQKPLPAYAKDFGTSTVPIIFVTAYNARYTKEELVKLGGDDLIPKPVDFTRLSLALSRCLVRKSQAALAK